MTIFLSFSKKKDCIYLDNVWSNHFAWTAPRSMKVNHHELRSCSRQLGLEVGHVRTLVNHDDGLI